MCSSHLGAVRYSLTRYLYLAAGTYLPTRYKHQVLGDTRRAGCTICYVDTVAAASWLGSHFEEHTTRLPFS